MFLIDSIRLKMRLMDTADIPALRDIWCDPDVMRFCGGPVGEERLDGIIRANSHRFERHGYAVFGVIRKSDGQLIGITGCKADGSNPRVPELVYHFKKEFWGQGYASEAVRAYIGWMGEHGLADVIHASVMPDNTPSLNILSQVGFVQKGYVRFADTGFVDEPYFELELNTVEKRGG